MKDEFHRRLFAGMADLPDFPAILGLACDLTPLDLTPYEHDAETNQLIRSLHKMYHMRNSPYGVQHGIALIMTGILCHVPHTLEALQTCESRTVRVSFTGIRGAPFSVSLITDGDGLKKESDFNPEKMDEEFLKCFDAMFGALGSLKHFLLYVD